MKSLSKKMTVKKMTFISINKIALAQVKGGEKIADSKINSEID